LMTNHFRKDDLFHSVQLFRQRLNEIDEVFISFRIFLDKHTIF
jgi:hypothetical protein